MEGNDNLRAWGYCYYDSHNSLKTLDSHNSLKALNFMPSIVDRKPTIGGPEAFISGSNGRFHREYGSPTPHFHPSEYNLPEACLFRDNKFYNVVPTGYHSYAVPTETPPTNYHLPMHMLRQLDTSNEEMMDRDEPSSVDINSGPLQKRSAEKSEKLPKTKKQKKASSLAKDGGRAQRANPTKKTIEVVINGIDMDISSIPIPVCSCTGVPQQCYRWGFGGWQSACCTTGMSMYPLPMSTKRRGARIAGRKMSLGAFKKVLEKLAAEGYNFSNPIDLRTHWAKHGTNKFVTIR